MLTPIRRLSSLIGIHEAPGATIPLGNPAVRLANLAQDVAGASSDGGLASSNRSGDGHHDDGRVVFERFSPAVVTAFWIAIAVPAAVELAAFSIACRRPVDAELSAVLHAPLGDPVGEEDESLAAI